jgi:hypothetical protein
MIGILKFKLPEERLEHEMALKASDYASALSSIREHLRGKLKHGELSEEQRAVLEELQRFVCEQTEGLEF